MKYYESVVVATGDGTYAMELLPGCGGILNRLTHTRGMGQKTELMAGLPDQQALANDRYYRGAPLYPWVNRLDAGRYEYQDRHYQGETNESDTKTSLHGFLVGIRPGIVELEELEQTAFVTLLYRYQGENPVYPFAADISLRYSLHSNDGLSLQFDVLNRHHAVVPLGLGWHPYFTLGLPFIHIFIPPDRLSVALEPVSCGINAFNTGDALVHLEAGAVYSASCGVRLI